MHATTKNLELTAGQLPERIAVGFSDLAEGAVPGDRGLFLTGHSPRAEILVVNVFELIRNAVLLAEVHSDRGTEDIIVTMEAGDCVESIYKTIYQKDGNEVCLIDKLEGKDGGSDSIIDNIMINELVDSLCERDRKLIRMRYYEDMTQTQAARVLGISQVQVSRLEKKILNRMRSQIDIE